MLNIKFKQQTQIPAFLDLGDVHANMIYDPDTDALITRPISDSETLDVKINFVSNKTGNITIWAGCSCEERYDSFKVWVTNSSATPLNDSDGYKLADFSGEIPIEQLTHTVNPGNHWIHFVYSKDSSLSKGRDGGLVSQIELPIDPSANIKVNGTWVPYTDQFIKIQGTWLPSLESYIKINGSWNAYIHSLSFQSVGIRFIEERFESMYGWIRHENDYLRIASGFVRYGTCVARTNRKVTINAGQTLKMNICHFALHQDGAITDPVAQRGIVYISPNPSYDLNDPSAQFIYDDPDSPGLGEVFFERSISVSRSDDYYIFVAIDGDSERYDTHMLVGQIYADDTRIF